MATHLGFDMGIRNLAYCLMKHDLSGGWTILAWDNIDLLEGGASSQTARSCVGCNGKASWCDLSDKWCNACATGVRRKKTATKKPTLPTIMCSLSVKELRNLSLSEGFPNAKKAKKEELVSWASKHYLLPWKPAKAMDASLDVICGAMDTWLNSMLPTFASASLIRLENQPVMKGPTMKSVQMILFTLLHHRLRREHGWSGRITFVHAGVKSRDSIKPVVDLSGASITATEGAAYRARKKDATDDVLKHLQGASTAAAWLSAFRAKSKKSDLADAFLMALRA